MGSLGGKLIQLVKGQFFWTLRVQRSQSRCVGVAHLERTGRGREEGEHRKLKRAT